MCLTIQPKHPCDPRVASAFLPSAPIQLKWLLLLLLHGCQKREEGRKAVFVHEGIKFPPEGSGVQYRAMEGERGLAGDGELTKGHSALLSASYVTCQSVFLQEEEGGTVTDANGFVLRGDA